MTPKTFSLLAGLAVSFAAAAQHYPAKPVRIVTSTAGNFHDIVARRMADLLTSRWKQAVIVENRGGAGMILGTNAVAHAAADGYTLLLTDRSALAVAPSLQGDLPYDVQKDLAPVTLVASAPMLLLVERSVPAGDMGAFVSYMRKAPSGVTFASAGPGTGTHLTGEVLKQSLGVNLVQVHYKGSPAAMTALLGGDTQAAFMLLPVALPHVRSGRVKALAITANERFPDAPDVPTVAEAGFPQLESALWLALMAPARTPGAVIDSVRRAVSEVLADNGFRATLAAQGATVAQSTPAELAQLIRSETVRWKKVLEAANIKAN